MGCKLGWVMMMIGWSGGGGGCDLVVGGSGRGKHLGWIRTNMFVYLCMD